ncbi:MAG: MerR family transcriptional regulator [Firmicutes bacterium]|nr:MerR family transcriptional regulator [Bacillota bacterium]
MSYRIADLAKQFNVPDSTARTWQRQFETFLPGTVEEQHRVFSEAERETFAAIAQMKTQRLTISVIHDRLAQSSPPTQGQSSEAEPAHQAPAQPDPEIGQLREQIQALQRRIDLVESAQTQLCEDFSEALVQASASLQVQSSAGLPEEVIGKRDSRVLQMLEMWRTQGTASPSPARATPPRFGRLFRRDSRSPD